MFQPIVLTKPRGINVYAMCDILDVVGQKFKLLISGELFLNETRFAYCQNECSFENSFLHDLPPLLVILISIVDSWGVGGAPNLGLACLGGESPPVVLHRGNQDRFLIESKNP